MEMEMEVLFVQKNGNTWISYVNRKIEYIGEDEEDK